jgi:hypothetical protein
MVNTSILLEDLLTITPMVAVFASVSSISLIFINKFLFSGVGNRRPDTSMFLANERLASALGMPILAGLLHAQGLP